MKERDIRPAELFQRYLQLSAADAEIYFQKCPREAIVCPGCCCESHQFAFEKWGFAYQVCDRCGTLFQSPRPCNEAFMQFYQKSESAAYWAKTFFPQVAEARREKLFRPKAIEIQKYLNTQGHRPEKVADVGAGYGLFLDEWRRLQPDAELIAIEPNGELATVCRSKDFRVCECFLDEVAFLRDEIDLLVAFEVIEHVHDPMGFCNALHRLLCPGGRVLLTGLTVDGFDIQVLWRNSNSVSPPHHINFLTVAGFQSLLEQTGFRNIDIFTPGKLDVDIVRNAWLAQPKLLQGQRFVETVVKLDEDGRNDFQAFLQNRRLSSHCWIWAQK